MMNKKNRNQLIFLFVLLLIAAAAFGMLKLYQKEHPSEEGIEEQESYSALTIEQTMVTDIGIISNDGNINLTKEGADWKCLEQEDFSVDSSLVENFLAEICTITASDKIENVEDMSEYGLDNPSINLTLQWDNNMYLIKLGDYNSIISGYYLNINDENTVYVVNSSLYYSLNKSLEDFELKS